MKIDNGSPTDIVIKFHVDLTLLNIFTDSAYRGIIVGLGVTFYTKDKNILKEID